MHKIVDGNRVELSETEASEIVAEWARNDAANAAEIAEREVRAKAVADLKQAITSSPSGTVKNSDLKVLLDLLKV